MAVRINKEPRINLSKGQVINLTKDGDSESKKLSKVYFGVNWSAITHKKKHEGGIVNWILNKLEIDTTDYVTEDVDLDASVVMYDKDYDVIDLVYYAKVLSDDGSIKHSGDDTVGDTDGDDGVDNETISIDLDKVSSNTQYIAVILNSYHHQKFDEIPYAGLRIYTGKLGEPDDVLASYKISNNPDFKEKEAMVLGYFARTNGRWVFKADGRATKERSIRYIAEGSARNSIKGIN